MSITGDSGAIATILYNDSADTWNFNKVISGKLDNLIIRVDDSADARDKGVLIQGDSGNFATMVYNDSSDTWDFNKPINADLSTITIGVNDSADARDKGLTIQTDSSSIVTFLYDDSTNSMKLSNGLVIKGDILPSQDSEFNLGSDSNRWKDLFLSGKTIDLGGLLLKNVDGTLSVEDSAGARDNLQINNANVTGNITFVDDSGREFVLGLDSNGVFSFDNSEMLTDSSRIEQLANVRFDSAIIDSGSLLQWNGTYFENKRFLDKEIGFNDGLTSSVIKFKDSNTHIGQISQAYLPSNTLAKSFHTVQISNATGQGTDSQNAFLFITQNWAVADLNNNLLIEAHGEGDSNQVELYYDGKIRLETRAYGSRTIGQARADSAHFYGPVTLTGDSADLVAGTLTGDYLGFESDLSDSHNVQTIRGMFSTTGDLGYDSTTGIFSFEVESAYSKTNFDSDFNQAILTLGLDGTNLEYDSATKTINMAASGVTAGIYGTSTRIPVLTVDSFGTIDSAGLIAVGSVDSIQYDVTSKLLTIFTSSDDSFSTTIPSGGITVKETLSQDSVQASFSDITSIRFDNETGFNVDSFGPNEVKVSLGSGYKTIKVAGDSDLIAVGEDTLEIISGFGINLSTNVDSIDDKFLTIAMDSSYDAVFNSVTNTTGKTTTSPTVTSVSDGTVTVVDTQAHNSGFTSIEYSVHMHDSANGYSQLSKVLLTYNTTSVFFTEYGMVNSFAGDSDIGTLTADVNGGDLRLKFQRATGIGTVEVKPVATVIT